MQIDSQQLSILVYRNRVVIFFASFIIYRFWNVCYVQNTVCSLANVTNTDRRSALDGVTIVFVK